MYKKNLDFQSDLIPNADLGSTGKHPWLVRTSQSGRLLSPVEQHVSD